MDNNSEHFQEALNDMKLLTMSPMEYSN